jgi:hypothetical protein
MHVRVYVKQYGEVHPLGPYGHGNVSGVTTTDGVLRIISAPTVCYPLAEVLRWEETWT